MRFHAIGPLCLLFVPWTAAFPKPGVGIDLEWKRDPLDLRPRIPAILGGAEETSTTPATSASPTSTSTPPTSTSTTPTSTPPTSTPPTSTTQPTTTPTSAPASHSSAVLTTNDDGETVTQTIQLPASNTTSSAAPTSTDDDSSSGPSKGTYIGLGVAGGVAVLGLCGFIVWKFTQKRFSQFDDDGEDIKWPMPKEELAQPPAPPTMSAATNATNSSVDLSHDPYAVPPLPPQRTGPYYDDPSGTAGAAYYDPYRGPVPHTFNSPPPSSDGHIQQYAMGEAIPMSTYSSSNGRQSPGPNMAYADPYARTRSPGPNMAGYEDPYATGRRSPGPSLAYGMEPARVGTPVGGYGAPGVPPGLDVPRVGTPQSYGRASPAIPAGYAVQQPLVNPYGRSTPNPYGS